MLQTPDEHTQRILDLATFIEALPPHLYDQRAYGQPGPDKPKCICGWAQERRGESDVSNYAAAGKYLGLTNPLQLQQLFNGAPYWQDYNFRDPTTGEAARVLRHLAITGEIDWDAALTKPAGFALTLAAE